MHTDEYEISLAREVEVCRREIRRTLGELGSFEKRYGIETEEFMKRFNSGSLDAKNGEFTRWVDGYRRLRRWEDRLEEYEELFRALKI